MRLPAARNQNIVTQTIGDEILIYDLQINKAFCLNETSAIVYQNCDGRTDFAELKAKHNFPNEIIYLALDQLKKENLLEKDAEFLSPFNGLSRREVVKKIGLGSMIALPAIASVVAPTAANAQSGTCVPGLLAPGQTTLTVCVAAIGFCTAFDTLGCGNVFPGNAPGECCSGLATVGTCMEVVGGEQCACICT